jgi:hypothetical protein
MPERGPAQVVMCGCAPYARGHQLSLAAAGSPRYPNSLLRVCAVFSIFSRSPVSTACAKLASCFGVSVKNICTNSHKSSSSPCNPRASRPDPKLTMIRQVQTLLALREPRVPCPTTWRSFLLQHWLESASLRSLCESFLPCSASPRSGSLKARQPIPHRRNEPTKSVGSHRPGDTACCFLQDCIAIQMAISVIALLQWSRSIIGIAVEVRERKPRCSSPFSRCMVAPRLHSPVKSS